MSPCVFFQAKSQDQMMVMLPSNISGSLNNRLSWRKTATKVRYFIFKLGYQSKCLKQFAYDPQKCKFVSQADQELLRSWVLLPVGLEACLGWRQQVLACHREKELSWTHLFGSVPSQEHTCHSVQCYLSNLSSELLTENSQNKPTEVRSYSIPLINRICQYFQTMFRRLGTVHCPAYMKFRNRTFGVILST